MNDVRYAVPDRGLININEMEQGQYAVIEDKDSGYNGHVVFCLWNQTAVVLTTGDTWCWDEHSGRRISLKVRLLPKGTVITITVGEGR